MPTITREHRSPAGLLWLILFLLILCGSPAFAQDPVVNSADPAETEQGTVALEVIVKGDNFGSDSEVDFLVNCPDPDDPDYDPTCEQLPSGVSAYGVKRQGPKTLKFKIDVEEGAQIKYKLDIQVRSRGRTGKGIELFRVLEKTNPTQDKTPPGQPTNLSAATTYGSVSLSWTMPADDGTDASSGSVDHCAYNDGLGEPLHTFTWPLCIDRWVGPGIQQVCLLRNLEPATSYSWGVVCLDEAGNESIPAPIEFTTPTFTRDPSWTIEEVPIPLDGLVGHQFDPAGKVVIGGVMGLWDQIRKKKWSLVPTEIRIITGIWDDQSKMWSWSSEDVPGVANRMQIDPASGRPAFQGGDVIDARNGLRDLVYTYHDGAGWRNEIITTEPGLRSPLGFAFDPNTSQPVIAWCSEDEAGGVRLARRVGADQWSIESVAQEECADWPRSAGLAFDDDGNPAITYRADSAVKMVRWSGSAWIGETLCNEPDCQGMYTPSLVYDTVRGDFSAASDDFTYWLFTCDRQGDGPSNWQCEPPVLGEGGNDGIISNHRRQDVWMGSEMLVVDPFGELFLAHNAEYLSDRVLARRPLGSPLWTHEFVDHPSTRGLPPDEMLRGGVGGPFVALDPSYRPTLTWTWNLGHFLESPSEYHLYFAWKGTP